MKFPTGAKLGNNIDTCRSSCSVQLQRPQWRPERATQASAVRLAGVDSSQCSKDVDEAGEVEAVRDTDLLLPMNKHSELHSFEPIVNSSNIFKSTHRFQNHSIFTEVPLNPAPPGSPNGLKPGSPGSRGPQSTEWTTCQTTKLELN